MKQRRRSFIIIGSVIVITLSIVLFFSVINKKDNQMPAVTISGCRKCRVAAPGGRIYDA